MLGRAGHTKLKGQSEEVILRPSPCSSGQATPFSLEGQEGGGEWGGNPQGGGGGGNLSSKPRLEGSDGGGRVAWGRGLGRLLQQRPSCSGLQPAEGQGTVP